LRELLTITVAKKMNGNYMSKLKMACYSLTIILILVFLLGCSPNTNELVGTNWELVSLNGEELIEGTAITLEIAETYLGGQMVCNGYGGSPDRGSYQVGKQDAFEVNFLAVTVQLCAEPEGLMEQESEYIDLLLSARSFELIENRLVLENEASGSFLEFLRK
jgi:heat shock protein HslJ